MDRNNDARRSFLICALLAGATLTAFWPVIHHEFVNFDDRGYVLRNLHARAGLTWATVKWAFTSFYGANWHPLTWLSHALDCQWYDLNPGGHHLTSLLLHTANTVLLFLVLQRLAAAGARAVLARSDDVRKRAPEVVPESPRASAEAAADVSRRTLDQRRLAPTNVGGYGSVAWRSAFVAALFGLHPMHVESVAWVAERKDVLSGFFFMLTIWAYAAYAKSKVQSPESKVHSPQSTVRSPESKVLSPKSGAGDPLLTVTGPQAGVQSSKLKVQSSRFLFALFHPQSSILYLLALIFFACGLMSKPMLVTLPFVLLLLDYWPLRRVQSLKAKVLSLQSTVRSPRRGDPARSLEGAGVGGRGSQESSSILHPPFSLAVPRPSYFSVLLIEKLPFFALSAVLCYVTVLAQRSTGAIASMASVPLKQRVLNAVISYAVYLEKTVWPSRLAMYYPPRESLPLWTALGAGTALILVSLLAVKFARSRPYLLVGWLWYLGMLVPVIGLVQVGLQAMADRYTYLPLIGIFIAIAWGVSDLAIFNFQVPEKLACVFLTRRSSRREEAPIVVGATAAEKLEPPHVGCYNALAVTAITVLTACWCLTTAQVRLWKNSETLYRHTIAVAPKNPIVLGLLGDALVEQRRFAEGAEQFEAALRITPGYAEAESNLGFALVMQGHLDEGMEHYRKALELKPQLDTTHYVLGQALLLKGRRDEAIAEFRAALAVNPESPAALNDLAWILATDPDPSVRNGSEAVALGERTCSLTEYRNALFVGTLAAAYAEAGRFEDALRTGEKAREIALAGGQQALADRNAELLKEYRAGKPHREAGQRNVH